VVVPINRVTGESNNLVNVVDPSTLALTSSSPELVFTQFLATTSGACLSAADRAFVRDNAVDTAAVPSTNNGLPFWESPDLFLVPENAVVDLNSVASVSIITPEMPYDIYVRVNNDFGCNPVSGVKARVNLADPAMLSQDWKAVTNAVTADAYWGFDKDPAHGVTIPAGGRALLGPFRWTAPKKGDIGDGHRCLIASILTDSQPAPTNAFDAPNSYQVAQRNVQISDCTYPLTNATTINGDLYIALSMTGGATFASGGTPASASLTVDDSTGTWYAAWQGGSGYAVKHGSDGRTTVTLSQDHIDLPKVNLGAGTTVAANGQIFVPTGSSWTSVALEARLLDPATSTLLVKNGGSCAANGPVESM